MIEAIAMVSVLAGMGIYVVKSADLPKELKDRVAARGSIEQTINYKPKFNFDKKINNDEVKVVVKEVVKAELKVPAKPKIDLVAVEKEINDITLKVTTLEQEIKDNNQRNSEIQSLIDSHLDRLVELNLIRNQA